MFQGSSDQDKDDIEKDIVTERFIVDKASLQKLFHFCTVENCGSIIDPSDVTFHKVGAAVIVKSTCLNNHTQSWSSSNSVGEGHHRLFIINVLLAAYTLFCGLNISQVGLNMCILDKGCLLKILIVRFYILHIYAGLWENWHGTLRLFCLQYIARI